MHSMLLTLFSDKSYKGEPWSVFSRMEEIEERYLKIGPSSCITRHQRSLIANLGYLKAPVINHPAVLLASMFVWHSSRAVLLVGNHLSPPPRFNLTR